MKTLTNLQLPEQQKPLCPLIGNDGNIFNLIGIAARTLKENGAADTAKEMRSRVMDSGSYDQALGIIMEYVEPAGAGEINNEMEHGMDCDQTMGGPY